MPPYNIFYVKKGIYKMKIISEKTGKTYKTVEECLSEEKKFDEAIQAEKAKKEKLAENRKSRAKEVEDAYKARLEADKLYREKLNDFVNDYGSFHMTIDNEVDSPFTILDFLDNFWF